MRGKRATEYNIFADETWFCIKTLLLGDVMVIQMYCVEQGESVMPQIMNTVEWFFGDARQMVSRSTNKMTARTINWADKQASTFSAENFALVGNNSTGANLLGRKR